MITDWEQCVQSNREELREDPQRIIVTNNGKQEEKIYENMNKTHHYLCAEYGAVGSHVVSSLCVVPYDERLESLLKQEQPLNGTNHNRDKLIYDIFDRFCEMESDQYSVSVQLVESYDQCQSHVQLLQVIFSSVGKTKIVVISGIVVAAVGIVGNVVALSIFLGRDYQKSHKTCVYFAAKTVFETLHLVFSMWYNLSLMYVYDRGNLESEKFWEGMAHGVVKMFVTVGRNWMVAVISIEQCLAVRKPFVARQYLRKSIAIKVNAIVVIVSILYTAIDVMVQYFMSDRIDVYDSKLQFIGEEARIIVHAIVMSNFLPWTVTLVCTFLTAIGLKKAKQKRTAMQSHTTNVQNRHQNSGLENDFLLTRIILFSLVSVIIANVPIIIEYVLLIFSGMKMILILGEAVDIIILVAFFFHLLGNSIDFYLFLASIEEFRGQLRKNFQSVITICTTDN